MPNRLTKIRVTLRRANIASLSLAITLFQFSLAILLLVFGIALNKIFGSGGVILICGGIWVIYFGLIIYMTGPREKRTSDTDLGIFHILPIAMLLAAIPSMIGNLDHLNYMLGFVDFIVLMAMLVYGPHLPAKSSVAFARIPDLLGYWTFCV